MAARRPKLYRYDHCRDQVINWLEGCLEIPGSFALTPLNASKIITLLRRVPDDPPRGDPYSPWIGKRVNVLTDHATSAGWWTGKLLAVTPDAFVLDTAVINRAQCCYLELAR